MKQKDLVYLLVAVVIFLAAGYLVYSQIIQKPGSSTTAKAGVQVEVIGAIPSTLDGNAVAQLADPNQVKDFNSSVDLTGLGNDNPFGK